MADHGVRGALLVREKNWGWGWTWGDMALWEPYGPSWLEESWRAGRSAGAWSSPAVLMGSFF